MNELERYLTDRHFSETRRKVEWVDAARVLPGALPWWVERQVWSSPRRHMRTMKAGALFERLPDRGWSVTRRGTVIARSMPLESLIGRIGRPVSIVATGPTARDYPWEKHADGRLTTAVNGAPTLLKEYGIMPDLLVVTDPNFAMHGLSHFRNAPGVPLVTTCRTASVLVERSPETLRERPFAIIERVNSWYGVPALPMEKLFAMNSASGSPFHFPANGKLIPKVGWSDAPEWGFFSGCTVVFAALQVAIGLGAKHVEIIGMDLSGQGRAYDEGDDAQPTTLEAQYEKYILPSFVMMHAALAGSDVAVKNLSPVCPLPTEFFAS